MAGGVEEMNYVEKERDTHIRNYFNKGYTQKEILASLLHCHGLGLSTRQLKRDLKRLNLSRRKNNDSAEYVKIALQVELEGNGCNLGYRSMFQKLARIYAIKTSRDKVYNFMKELDPDGLNRRAAKRLKRRDYTSKGPNYVWHLDGYDKIKPYGFCIHGCIDGFSRKILWLEVASTNNNPAVIASYFINYVSKVKGTARRVRSDLGSENLNIAGIQRFFRESHTDSFGGEKSFVFGKSTSNQRIEAYWSKLKQSTSQFWMDFFAKMRDDGSLKEEDEGYRACLQFCFMPLIQKHLDETLTLHNCHRIRHQPNQSCPDGKPDLIYTIPEAYGAEEYLSVVPEEEIQLACETASTEKYHHGCSDEYSDLFKELMAENRWTTPYDEIEAKTLYMDLCTKLSELLI